MQSRASSPPEGTPLKSEQRGQAHKEHPAGEEAMDEEDYHLPWRDILKQGDSIKVEVSDLEHLLLGTEDAGSSITSLKEAVASSCCSTHLEAKEQAKALRWLMQRVLPKQQGK